MKHVFPFVLIFLLFMPGTPQTLIGQIPPLLLKSEARIIENIRKLSSSSREPVIEESKLDRAKTLERLLEESPLNGPAQDLKTAEILVELGELNMSLYFSDSQSILENEYSYFKTRHYFRKALDYSEKTIQTDPVSACMIMLRIDRFNFDFFNHVKAGLVYEKTLSKDGTIWALHRMEKARLHAALARLNRYHGKSGAVRKHCLWALECWGNTDRIAPPDTSDILFVLKELAESSNNRTLLFELRKVIEQNPEFLIHLSSVSLGDTLDAIQVLSGFYLKIEDEPTRSFLKSLVKKLSSSTE